MRINKVTLKLLSFAIIALLLAVTLANLFNQNKDPFQPTRGKLSPATIAGYYNQNFNWLDCYGGFKCATYKVPIDYENIELGEFDIAVMKHEAVNAIGNLVVNPGGPGGSGIDYAYSYADAFTNAVNENFNIVGFDPRGVGRSAPIDCLNNKEIDEAYASNAYPENAAELAQMQAETKKFAENCQAENKYLAFYATANAAKDMDILRALLGDAKLNFLGKSYGTYLGTLYAKIFPDRVGRFVLDGAVDPTLNSFQQTLQQAVGFDSAFNAFANDCIKQGNCALNDNFATQITDKLTEIRKQPIQVGDRQLTESLAMYGIAFGLYDQIDGWPVLRKALTDLFNSDGKALLDMADQYNRRDSNGNYLSNDASSLSVISCADFPPTGADQEQIKNAAPIFGKYLMYSEMDCEYLPKSKHELIDGPISMKTQVMVIGTTNDPATPYQWAVKLSQVLLNSILISVSGEGHTGYNRDEPCVDQAVEKYLISGVLPAQNLACGA